MAQQAIHLTSVDLCKVSVAPVEAVGAEIFEYFDIIFRVIHCLLQVTVDDTIIMAVHPLHFIILLTLVTTLPSLHPHLPLSHLLAPSIASDSVLLARGSFTPIESAGAHRVAQVYPSVLGAEEVLRVVEVEVAVALGGAG